ncbi:MAG: class I SAM-dependent methyltransferase [Ancrocorticia sp.]|jgi:SAM-dependent methyltransferase|nr:class I SAM-dependent methyltransferase [Ancrocorticia sp.]MCI2194282.1 class I SAM-dependent methyltransferase [Ancrocorticia sp.]MCI2199510.1 class I SAM-dependent methyltransferase [Ancrocorticia sp.]
MTTIPRILTDEGRALLASLPAYDPKTAITVGERLRAQGYAADLVAQAMTQQRLREHATTKFGPFAQQMFFTQQSLEQATRLEIAVHHAARFREAGATHVIDAGCGIGADSLAFAGLGLRVTAFEIDSYTAAFARANLASFPEATVVCEDATTASLPPASAIWLDPARRDSAGHRIKDPSQWAPPLHSALALANAQAMAGIKVAPGIAFRALPSGAHVQWISHNGELAEAVIWTGDAAKNPGRSALVIRSGKTHQLDAHSGQPHEPSVRVPPAALGPYLYEPDPAVIRAGGIAAICETHSLAPISQDIAYLSGAEVTSPYLAKFEVFDVVPLTVKAMKSAIRNADITRLEIKKRGTDREPQQLRHQLGLSSKNAGQGSEATLVLSPVMGKHTAILARRIG